MRLLPFALLALATPLHAQSASIYASPELNSFNYDILCYYDNDNPNVPMTPAEIAQINATTAFFDDVSTDGATKIPVGAGVTFGVLSNYPEGVAYDVTSTITHIARDGTVTEDTVTLRFDDVLDIDGWTFDSAAPGNLGIYRFQTFRNGQVIYDLSFDVVTAEEFAGPLPPCVTLP
ncbi:DUF3859 domain-containing protein [Rhodobacteraceae bacterium N5(2021)]|uniref:DUF3859 domain-containing protein n=1 Tax=Gymnodinialimonas phycosphaerae TaxID=2841589 RepID=A0A975YFE1_9RHOB|nr:DUF3859 domain-containing protein [Gymnodinialimonas phycosphaerae]MBY4894616.1 DUF3859 domain-containing protein [Gymnodinialimonas phycosphaerae]